VLTRSVAICLMICALGAAPATNPSSGKFDNVALRVAPQKSSATQQSGSSSESSSLDGLDTRRVALSLAGVITLILLLRVALRKLFPQAGAARSSAVARVLARTVIAPKQQVILLQVGRRVVVVGDCGTQMTPLAEITDADEIALLVGQVEQDKSGGASRAFGGLFHRARKPFEEPADEPAPQRETSEDSSGELVGLSEKIRLLSAQFRRGAS